MIKCTHSCATSGPAHSRRSIKVSSVSPFSFYIHLLRSGLRRPSQKPQSGLKINRDYFKAQDPPKSLAEVMWGPGDSEHKRDRDHPMELFPFHRGETKAESKRPRPCASKFYHGASVGSRQLNLNHQINSGPTGNASFSSQAEGSSPCI